MKIDFKYIKKMICNHIFKYIWVLQIKDYIKSTKLIFCFASWDLDLLYFNPI